MKKIGDGYGGFKAIDEGTTFLTNLFAQKSWLR